MGTSYVFGQEEDEIILLIEDTKSKLSNGNLDDALRFGLKGLEVSEQLKEQDHITTFNFLLAEVYLNQDNFAKSIEYYINIIYQNEVDSIGNVDYLAKAYYSLGKLYTLMNAYNQATNCLLKSIQHYKSTEDHIKLIESNHALAENYFKSKKYSEALSVYQALVDSIYNLSSDPLIIRRLYEDYLNTLKHNKLFEKGIEEALSFQNNTNRLSHSPAIQNLLSYFYRQQKNYDLSIKYGREATNKSSYSVNYLYDLGDTYLDAGQVENALIQFNKALVLSESSGSKKALMISYNHLGKAYFVGDDLREATNYLQKAQVIGVEHNYIFELEVTYNLLLTIFEIRKIDPEIRNYQFMLKDLLPRVTEANLQFEQRVINADNLASSLEQRARYELAEKRRQELLRQQESQKVKLLEQERTIQLQQLDRQNLEALAIQQNLKIAEQQLESQRKESTLENLQKGSELARLRALESHQELELANREKLILEQQSELQNAQINAVSEKQQLLSVLLFLGLIVLLILLYFIFKITRSKKIIAIQNKNLEFQQNELQLAKTELTDTLIKEQSTRKKLESSNEELKSTQSQLIHAEKMSSLGQLTAGIVHEINNPVNFIKGGIETINRTMEGITTLIRQFAENEENKKLSQEKFNELKEELISELEFTDEVVPQLMEDVLFGAKRIEDIVNGLRIFSRNDTAEIETVSLHETIDAALLILRPKYANATKIEKKYDSKIDKIDCLPGQLNQVFVNLISNAIDALGEAGEIVITTKDIGKKIRISIQDNGKGIPPEIIDHIFEPFYTTKEVGKGTGLGLSISYSIINKHKGTIVVDSEIDEGTKFTIELWKEMTGQLSDNLVVSTIKH